MTDATLALCRKLTTVKVQGYVWENSILMKNMEDELGNHRSLVVLPKQDRLKAMELAHEKLGHAGKRNVLNILSRSFVWPLMAKDVHAHVHSCSVCQKCDKQGLDVSPWYTY